ncbi:MAG: hypothetical protein HOW73_12890 [Polyangiaceae bacterium]|nr:hypothetical protein [Polyangiaceae bacterium]
MRAVVLALAVLVGGSVAAVARDARAHGGAGGAQLPADAEPVTADGKKAKELLAALPADDASKALVADSVKKAKLALGRANGAKLAGDQEGAQILSRLALAWAQTATSTVKAVDTEKRASEAEARTKDRKEKIGRARSLLAETEARKLQLVAEVAKAEEAAKKGPPSKADKDKKPGDKKGEEKKAKPDKKAAPPDQPQPKAPEKKPSKAENKPAPQKSAPQMPAPQKPAPKKGAP